MIKPKHAEAVLQAKLEVTEGHFYPENMAPVLGVYSNYGVKTYECMLCPFDKTPFFVAEFKDAEEVRVVPDIKEFCMLHKVPIRINPDNTVDFIRVWKFIPALSSPISDSALDLAVTAWSLGIIEQHERELTEALKISL